jgi:menaquinone-dependent protoporphyrinogen oxidase
MAATAARSHCVFGGRLDRTSLGFAERAISRALRAPFGDFRDWAEIEAWASGIAAELLAVPAHGAHTAHQ